MGLEWVLVLAGISMIFQDLIAVTMVQAESRNKAALSGVLDMAGWGLAITTNTIAISALQGHNTGLKIAVIAVVSVANFIGSYSGVKIGEKYIKPDPNADSARITKIEQFIGLPQEIPTVPVPRSRKTGRMR